MDNDARIYVAGHTGMLGSALCRALAARGCKNVITRTHAELELTDARAVEAFFAEQRPEYVFLAAGVAGGIHLNKTAPAELIYANLAIETNVIHQAWRHEVRKLLFVGSACAYPKHCQMPISPEALMTAPIEPTSAPFATSKIAGIRLCQAYHAQYGAEFLPVIPSTMYGPGDHFDTGGHVVAALLGRFHQAKCDAAESVTCWGTGTPRREFLYVDDAAEGMIFLMDRCRAPDVVNLGYGEDVSIAELASAIAEVVGFTGEIAFDPTKPDGMPQRLLDSACVRDMGFSPRTTLTDGLRRTYEWFLAQGG